MSDIRNGMVITFKEGLYEFVEFLHVKPGKGAAFVRSKLKNLKTGQVIENTFRGSDHFDEVRIESAKMQYLYQDGDFYVFMDNETYEQSHIPNTVIGELANYLIENIEVKIRTTPDKDIVGIELPTTVSMKITEADPNIKGSTASGSYKNAVVETGMRINVPFFIEAGDTVKIDTRTGNYLERI